MGRGRGLTPTSASPAARAAASFIRRARWSARWTRRSCYRRSSRSWRRSPPRTPPMAEPDVGLEETKQPDYVEHITKKSDDFNQWYIDVVRKAELADYTPIRGCMVIRPYGFALWERVR